MPYGEYGYGEYGYKGEQPPAPVPLVGERVFQWRPDWKDGVSLGYVANTVISESQYHVEQRRALHGTLKRRTSFTVADDEYLPAVENFLRRWHSDIIWMPLWQERLVVTAIGGGGILQISVADTTDRYNLNNLCTHLALIDQNLSIAPELFVIDTISADVITIETSVVGAYTTENALLYPVITMYLDTNTLTDITAHYGQYALAWREWF